MSMFFHDVRYAVRILRQRPLVTTVILVTLSIGIGLNTAIFSFVDGLLLKPLPYPNGDRIVSIWERRPSGQPNAMSALNYLDLARENKVFEHLAATTMCCSETMLGGEPAPTPAVGLRVSAAYFDVFGMPATYGRTFRSGEDASGHDRVVVISHRLWATRFGSDRSVIGRTILVDNEPYVVIGVMPENSAFDRGPVELWVPVSFEVERSNRSSHWLLSMNGAAIGLLKPGITIQQARAELEGIAGQLAAAHPDTNRGWSVVVEPYGTTLTSPDTQRSLYLAVAAVVFVLLIACVNVANMLLAWALGRHSELITRLALGATPALLIRQLLTESLILSMASGALAIGFGYGTMSLVRSVLTALPVTIGTLPMRLPADAVVTLDARALMFAVGISVICAVAVGLAPVVAATQLSPASIASGKRTSGTKTHRRLRDTLIVAEMALAFVLLTSAILLIRSLSSMRDSDVGFDAKGVVTVQISASERHFAGTARRLSFMEGVIAQIRMVPGVIDAAFIDGMPMNGPPRGTFVQRAVDPVVARAERPLADLKIVSPSYFRVLGLHLQLGRVLAEHDRDAVPLVAVINETMARTLFPRTDPLGQRLLMDAPARDSATGNQSALYEVVGVVADERLRPFNDRRTHSVVYVSNLQDPRGFAGVIIRTSVDIPQLDRAVREAVIAIDKDVAVTHLTTMAQWLSESMIPNRFRSVLLTVLAVLALVLASIGIYGVLSYSLIQRRQEMGIRAAVGATRGRLVALLVRQGALLLLCGIGIGAAVSVAVGRLLRTLLFGVSTNDPLTWILSASIVVTMGLISCYLPARNAAGLDPLEAIRRY